MQDKREIPAIVNEKNCGKVLKFSHFGSGPQICMPWTIFHLRLIRYLLKETHIYGTCIFGEVVRVDTYRYTHAHTADSYHNIS